MMRSDQLRISDRSGPSDDPNVSGQFDLASVVRLLRRNRQSIALSVAAAIIVGFIYVLTATPVYLAGSQILIDARRTRVDPTGAGGGTNLSLVELGMDPASVDSQVEVLRSERIALTVLRRLHLDHDPSFTAPTTLPGKALSALSRMFVSDRPLAAGDGISAETIENFAKRLDVRRIQQTYVIAVSFYDKSAERAAAIVNAVTAAYLESQLQANSEAVHYTSAWLKRRIGEVREEAAAADQAVQRFKAEHGIVETGTGPLVSEAQLNELSSALVKARSDAAQTQARESHLRDVLASNDPASGLDASLSSDGLNRLRDQRTDLTRREADVARRFGADHVTAQGLRGEIRDTDTLILAELHRLAAAAAGSLAVARAREASLEKSVADMDAAAAARNSAQVTLRGFQRDFDGLKVLYEGLLARYNASLQQQSFPVSEARVLAEARSPERKNQPNTSLILVLSAIGGLAAAIAAALLRELGDRSFRVPHQVETGLGVPFLGVLPDLHAGRTRLPFKHADTDSSARFVETLTAVGAETDHRTSHGGARIIGIVSTFEAEGSTTVATSLAALVAASGRRVVLIDAHPTGGEAQRGPAEATATTMLPSVGDGATLQRTIACNATELGALFARFGQAYDDVIVDLPPLATASELRALAPLIGVFVLVLAWGRTDRAVAAEALRAVPLVRDRLAGAVLNMTDLRTFRLAVRGTADAFYAPPTIAHAAT